MYQNQTQTFAEMYWDFMDVNANLERAEWVARRIGNGLHSAVNFGVMVILFLFSFGLAWHFDFHSTYSALEQLITHLINGLPAGLNASNASAGTAALVVAVVTGIVTVAPTLTEIFASNLARANILVIKVFVLGFSAFDVITDIPTTKAWIATWQPSFDALGPILSPVVYWVAFFIWLAMATVGFQISVAIFAYLVIIYFKKMTVGMPTSTPYKNTGSNKQSNQQQQPKQQQQPQTPIQVIKVGADSD